MRNLICMTWGFSLPFFSSWKSQVASIIYTSLRLFLSFPLCSLPSFFFFSSSSSSLHLLFSLLAIWLLQLLLISILQNLQMPPKIIHLPALWCRFTCIQTTLSTFCTAFLQTKAKRDKVSFYSNALKRGGRRPLVWCFLTSSFTPITSSIKSAKGFWHGGDDWWSVSSQSRFKWTLNIHADQVKTECIIFMLFKG